MSKINIFCFGFGQVAECFINKLIQEKRDFDLSITSRQETHQIEINNFKITSYHFTNENFANPASIIWQSVETDYWKKFLKESIKDFESKTSSQKAKRILVNFEAELKNFKQVCPIEMLDKLDNPISLKPHVKRAG